MTLQDQIKKESVHILSTNGDTQHVYNETNTIIPAPLLSTPISSFYDTNEQPHKHVNPSDQ